MMCGITCAGNLLGEELARARCSPALCLYNRDHNSRIGSPIPAGDDAISGGKGLKPSKPLSPEQSQRSRGGVGPRVIQWPPEIGGGLDELTESTTDLAVVFPNRLGTGRCEVVFCNFRDPNPQVYRELVVRALGLRTRQGWGHGVRTPDLQVDDLNQSFRRGPVIGPAGLAEPERPQDAGELRLDKVKGVSET